jgi:hypothetical protein
MSVEITPLMRLRPEEDAPAFIPDYQKPEETIKILGSLETGDVVYYELADTRHHDPHMGITAFKAFMGVSLGPISEGLHSFYGISYDVVRHDHSGIHQFIQDESDLDSPSPVTAIRNIVRHPAVDYIPRNTNQAYFYKDKAIFNGQVIPENVQIVGSFKGVLFGINDSGQIFSGPRESFSLLYE